MQSITLSRTIKDLVEGVGLWRVWLLLGWQDLRLRYRRSVIGPLWITLSMATMVYTMGFLYAKLFKVELNVYYPYVAGGMITWNFIAMNIGESTEVMFQHANFIKQIKLPYTIYILRLLTRNTLVFLHNTLVIVPIIFIFHVNISLVSVLVFIVNLALLNFCAFSYLFVVSILGTRFQDVKPIIMSIVQICFLLTPVMWMPNMIPERYTLFTELNPFYQIVTLIRQPMIGQIPDLFTYTYMLCFTLAGFTLMFLLLLRCRHRIAFWV